VLKPYGEADANPYEVKPYYTGPGTYSMRLEEDHGGTGDGRRWKAGPGKNGGRVRRLALRPLGCPSPVKETGANAVRIRKNPDGDTLAVTYDATSCGAAKAILLYGAIGTYEVSPTPYAGCADADLGNVGEDLAVDASGLTDVWFNVVWTEGRRGTPRLRLRRHVERGEELEGQHALWDDNRRLLSRELSVATIASLPTRPLGCAVADHSFDGPRGTFMIGTSLGPASDEPLGFAVDRPAGHREVGIRCL